VCGIEEDIVGRGSYDNIIEDFGGAVNDDSGQGVSAVKECKAQEQAEVKEKKWKEQIGAERGLKH
jgi:hypothetical protein